MNKLTPNYFIKIIIEIINEKQLNSNESGLFLFIYTTIIHDVLSIYCSNIKSFNSEIIKIKYPWYKLLLFGSKLHEVIIIYLNIELLKLINRDIDSKLLDNYLKLDILELLSNSLDYNLYLENNNKIFEEIKIHIDNMYVNYAIKNIFASNNNDVSLFFSVNSIFKILLDKKLFNEIMDYSLDKYKKMNKINEMIEILNLSQNLNYEQKILSNFWICIINKIGVFGFWNFILCINIENIVNPVKQIDLFYKLNLLLYNGIFFINEIKKSNNSISPYGILKDNVLEFNNNSLWFIENNIQIKNTPMNEFPSEINLLSIIASKFLSKFIIKQKNIIITGKDLGLIYEYNNLYQDFIDLSHFPILIPNEKIFQTPNNQSQYKNNNPIIVNFSEFNDIYESVSKSYLYLIQSYLTSNLISKEVGTIIFDYLSKFLDHY